MQQLTDKLFVCPQIDLEDVPQLRQRGIRTVICNRPDGEEEGQIGQELVARDCKIHGMDFIYQPVQTSSIDDDTIKEFSQTLGRAEAPVLAYCRTGTRCTILWALSMRESLGDVEVLRRAEAAGYDLTRFIPPSPARA